jgi:photosystem II stability/assembly factor-like uncharacterized protein
VKRILRLLPLPLVLIALLLPAGSAIAKDDDQRVITERDLGSISWRAIGPANMGGRVSAIALVPGSRTEFYVGFATGGIFKTGNLGTSFSEVFRDEATSSIGAIDVANAPENWTGWDDLAAKGDTVKVEDRAEQGRGRIVWVGTGEGNGRNSVSWGNGVYRSVDGGGSFEHVGLTETHNIPRLAVDPGNPEVCYVASLGHLWGENPERGLYKTADGGESWDLVLKGKDHVGACEVVLDPSSSSTVYAALYKARRTAWSFDGFSDQGGIYRSDDAGANWTRLTNGLPARTGRIGLTVFAGDPNILYAVVESDQGGTGRSAWDDRSPAGGLFRSDDRGENWRRVNDLNFRPFYFSRVAVDPVDAERVYMPGWDVAISTDGGKNFVRSGSTEVHVDHHAIVICPDDPKRIFLGNDGGIYVSHDAAATWDFLNHLNVGQFYHVDVDNSKPFRVGGGLQDNGTWIGPSATSFQSGSQAAASILNEDWTAVYGGDGFRLAFDPVDPNIIYATAQAGNLGRVHLDTQLTKPLRASADEGQKRIRWNWDAPFLISAHDPTVLYHAGNKVFKLLERGEYWYAISEDLTRQEVDKVMAEGSNAEAYGTLTALAESPLEAGVLWAGSDDGLIHVTMDDGKSWKDVTPKNGDDLYVAHLEASRAKKETAYCAIDGHRSDVFRPIVLMTENGGKKWKDISGNLPADSPVRVVREDPGNPEVLYCGNEVSAYVSFDRGKRWLKLGGKSMPTVPVYDLAMQQREHSLVAATHGRSLYIMDGVGCFADLPDVVQEPLHLFPIAGVDPQQFGFRGYGSGNRVFRGANPTAGAVITYWLKELPEGAVSIAITNEKGEPVRTLSGPARPGLNRTAWDLQADEKHRIGNARLSGPVFVEPGTYNVSLSVGEESASGTVEVGPYPGWIAVEDKEVLAPVGPQ